MIYKLYWLFISEMDFFLKWWICRLIHNLKYAEQNYNSKNWDHSVFQDVYSFLVATLDFEQDRKNERNVALGKYIQREEQKFLVVF